jgi:hypothetical protein
MSMLPSALSFTVNTHRQPIVLFPLGSETSSHVEFLCKAFISSFIVVAQLGSVKASYMLLGMETLDN